MCTHSGVLMGLSFLPFLYGVYPVLAVVYESSESVNGIPRKYYNVKPFEGAIQCDNLSFVDFFKKLKKKFLSDS